MTTETVALVGTRKGLWIGRSDERRETWEWDGPHFDMQEVYSCMVDTRGGRTRLLAGAASSWLGPQVAYSDNLGGSWEHGPDGGIRFPADAKSLTAAISTGGVYQTTDGGGSWSPRNQGIRAEFLPEGQQYPEFGQCVHKVTRHPARPERMYLQNHGGVYRSDDHGAVWKSIADGLPAEFGFPIVVHPHDPDTVYVFPINGGDRRYPPQAKARVWRSRDAGETWEELGEGLPDGFFVAVMRDAMCTDGHEPAGLYFGARNGAVWGSADEGDTWRQLVSDLPDVMCFRAAAI